MNKVFKVGLIGCGHIAETYFRGHQYFNNFKIVACADINQKAAEKCAKLYNIKSMTVNEILKDKDILNTELKTRSFFGDQKVVIIEDVTDRDNIYVNDILEMIDIQYLRSL